MKKILAVLMASVIALSMAACGGSKDSSEDQSSVDYASMSDDELKEAITTVTEGKLTVATSPDFAPYEFYAIPDDGTPTLAGFDVALAQYIADYLGLQLEMVPMDFDGTLAELAAKKTDLAMAGYSPDPDREDKMDFSIIYYTGGQSFVSTKEKASQFTSLDDANDPSFSIGAQTGSIQVGLAEANTPDADIVQLAKVTDIIAELISGKLDGGFIETAVAQSYAQNYDELEILFDVPYDQEGSVVGVYKGNAALLEGVNRAIQAALDDGSMDSFVAEANELASGNIYEGVLDE